MRRELYTVGHSNQSDRDFVDMLRRNGIVTLADVRSVPFSRYTPQFNRDLLRELLGRSGIEYVDLCRELGARRAEPECYVNGAVDFRRVERSPLFLTGIHRLLELAGRGRIAMMCAEKDPLQCHRAILIGRHLRSKELDLFHIRGSDSIETHAQTEKRLLNLLGVDACDLFRSAEEILDDAYAEQAAKIAFRESEDPGSAETQRRLLGD